MKAVHPEESKRYGSHARKNSTPPPSFPFASPLVFPPLAKDLVETMKKQNGEGKARGRVWKGLIHDSWTPAVPGRSLWGNNGVPWPLHYYWWSLDAAPLPFPFLAVRFGQEEKVETAAWRFPMVGKHEIRSNASRAPTTSFLDFCLTSLCWCSSKEKG